VRTTSSQPISTIQSNHHYHFGRTNCNGSTVEFLAELVWNWWSYWISCTIYTRTKSNNYQRAVTFTSIDPITIGSWSCVLIQFYTSISNGIGQVLTKVLMFLRLVAFSEKHKIHQLHHHQYQDYRQSVKETPVEHTESELHINFSDQSDKYSWNYYSIPCYLNWVIVCGWLQWHPQDHFVCL